MEWTVRNNKIQADGVDQAAAVYLWTLQNTDNGNGISLERKLILDFKRMPAVARLGFGTERTQAEIEARRAIGYPETIPLVVNRQPVPITQYREEITRELRKGGAQKLVEFLGL
jgi:hypothetical protein